jgi:heat shock protein HslJ
MPRAMLKLVPIMLAAAACGAGSDQSGAANASADKATDGQASPEPTLYGSWTIIAVNGAPPLRFPHAEAGGANIAFSPGRYGGSSGCNSFGGTGLLVGNRWFGEPPMATQQGCAELAAQEQAIFTIASGGPQITFQGSAEATLTAKAGSLRLRRDAAADPAPAARPPMLLAGTRWQVGLIDGRPASSPAGRVRQLLAFEADRWTLAGGCAPLSGSWRQQGDRVLLTPTSPAGGSGCTADQQAARQSLLALFAASPLYVVGPNREFVMGGGEHWLSGEFDREFGRDDKALLRGEWRIDSVDGAVPKKVPRPPSLIFGNASYALWDGCNHSEGVQITFARQLFTRGSGVTTLALCEEDPLRRRIHRIVGTSPRFARTESGGMALVSHEGSLRLTRLSARPFGTHETFGLRPPRTIDLIQPKARLRLHARRFTITLDCGRIEGDWRGGQPARFSPDPIERTGPDCAQGPGSDAFQLGQFFTGNVLAVTGPNNDIVLLVNEDRSIAARVAN